MSSPRVVQSASWQSASCPVTARCGLLLETEQRGLSVGLSVTTVSPAKAAEPIVMPFGMMTGVGPRNHVGLLGGVQILTREDVILRAKSGRARTCQDMSGDRSTQSDSAGGSTGTVRMPVGCNRWGSYWRNMAKMLEPSVCGGDTALCQITLTTQTYTTRPILARLCLHFHTAKKITVLK